MIRWRRPDPRARLALMALSALLLTTSIQREPLAAVGTVALVPWLLALARARIADVVASGALLGFAYGLLLATWIPSALQGLGSSAVSSYLGLFAVCAVVGPPEFVGLALLVRITARSSTGTRVLVLAAAVFAIEKVLSRATWSVPWALLGYSQVGVIGVAQLAVVGGVPLISALLVALQVAITDSLLRRKGAAGLAIGLAAAWIALALAGLPIAEAVRPAQPTQCRWISCSSSRTCRAASAGAMRSSRSTSTAQECSRIARPPQSRPGSMRWCFPRICLTARVDASPELSAALAEWVDDLGVPVLSGLVLSASPPSPDLYRSSDRLARAGPRDHGADRQGARDSAARVESAIPRRFAARSAVRKRRRCAQGSRSARPASASRADLGATAALLRGALPEPRRAPAHARKCGDREPRRRQLGYGRDRHAPRHEYRALPRDRAAPAARSRGSRRVVCGGGRVRAGGRDASTARLRRRARLASPVASSYIARARRDPCASNRSLRCRRLGLARAAKSNVRAGN